MFNNMLTGIVQKVGQIDGVASSSRCTVKLPIGLTFEYVRLVMANITAAQCTNIQVRLNGQVVQEYRSGTEMELVNDFQDKNYVTVANQLLFDFRRIGCTQREDRDMTLIRTGVPNKQGSGFYDVATFELSFDLASGLTSPSISAYASMVDPAPLGVVRYVRSLSYTPSGTGDYEISDVPRQMLIERIAYNITTGVFTEVKNKINGNVVYEGPLSVHNADQNNGVRVTQSNWFFMEPDPRGDGRDWIDARPAADFRQVLTISTAGNIPVVLHQIGPLGA